MKTAPKWQYDEMKPCGVDFTNIEEVVAYDLMHRKFRDYAKLSEEIIRRLGLGSGSIVIDIGSGTGAFALHASRKCRTVYSVDISLAMLEYCRQHAERQGLSNIVFCHGGLLTYEHAADLADAIVCVAVLHHLPDFWKQVALKRCHAMLKPGGRLCLFDIVFPSQEENIWAKIEEFIQAIGIMADARLAQEAVIHVKDEFSTYDWIWKASSRGAGSELTQPNTGTDFRRPMSAQANEH